MNINPQLKRKIRISLRLIAFGVSAGLFFVILSDGFGDWYPLVNGAVIGLIIAIVASIFELNVYEKWIRQQHFFIVLATRSLFYFFLVITIILFEIGSARMLKENLDLAGLMKNEAFNYYIFGGEFVVSVFYTLALAIIINFTRQLNRKLGEDTINSMITGKNYKPKEVEKIFMFLNIPSSNTIINQIGRMNFHRFINDIVYDITLPILSNHGHIYQYVEDEMVIIWRMNEGIQHAKAIRCFFDIKDELHEQKEKYLKKYGISPIFNAALHCGKVVKGEIGFIKSEVVYHGDVINTTSRILDVCNNLENEVLVTAQLLQLLDLPLIYRSEKCEEIKLKGKKEMIQLYKIEEKDIKTMAYSR